VDNAVVHVVAGVLRDGGGRILLTQRPPGKHLAGLWEFPGGKCEADEAPLAALRRELREEIGVEIGTAEKLIAVPWRYADKSICLDVYTVHDYAGEPHGREGQLLQWADAQAIGEIDMPPADRPVVAALRLPRHYLITAEPDDATALLQWVERSLAAGGRLFQLRAKRATDATLRPLARTLLELTRRANAIALLNDHSALADELGFDGVHLSGEQLMRCRERPLPYGRWLAASCHDTAELERAVLIGADFVVLGPVKATPSHHAAPTLGWERFAALCAKVPLPVYALGGMSHADLPVAIGAGAQGIAGISAFR
jgi:8-oxo-dGTP diphosphatase